MKEQMGFHPSMPVFTEESMAGQIQLAKPTPSANQKLDDMPIGMAYVPMQKWQNIYEEDLAFSRGTIFEDLDLPFIGEAIPR